MFCVLIYSRLNIGSQNPHPSENTGWRRYIFIFSPFNQLDKYWPTLALKCSNLYFGGYAVVFGEQDDTCKPEG